MSNKNPYSQASDAYGKTSASAPNDQRSLEGQALMKAAQKLQYISDKLKSDEQPTLEQVADAFDYNRKLWTIFAGETSNDEHPLPKELKNNIANLSLFIFKRTIELYSDPTSQGISALIDINRQIASGLLKKPPVENKPPVEKTNQASPTTDTNA